MDAQLQYRQAESLIGAGRTGEAVPLLRGAAEAGLAAAGLRLAQYLLHFGDEGTSAEALHHLSRACEAGHPGAAYLSAWVAVGGHLLPQDVPRMAQWLLAAAQAGLMDAGRAVAVLQSWDDGSEGTALPLLATCAERGDRLAARMVGVSPAPRAGQTAWPTAERIGLWLTAALRPPAAQSLAREPDIAVTDGALPALGCRYLCEVATPRLRPSQVRNPLTGQAVRHPLRTSDDAALDPLEEDFVLRLLQARLAAVAGLPLVQAEHLVLLHYAPGQEYRPHTDDLPPGALAANRPSAGQRQRTLCTYLNEVAEGGHTEFPRRGIRVQPAAGRALAFDSLDAQGAPAPASLHAGAAVERGEKWLATLWFRQRAYRSC